MASNMLGQTSCGLQLWSVPVSIGDVYSVFTPMKCVNNPRHL